MSCGEKVGKARFAVYGKSAYPDATFTLRLAYGTVKGHSDERTMAPQQDNVLRSLRSGDRLRFQGSVESTAALH